MLVLLLLVAFVQGDFLTTHPSWPSCSQVHNGIPFKLLQALQKNDPIAMYGDIWGCNGKYGRMEKKMETTILCHHTLDMTRYKIYGFLSMVT